MINNWGVGELIKVQQRGACENIEEVKLHHWANIDFSHGAVAQSVECPSKGPGSRWNSNDVGTKDADAAA